MNIYVLPIILSRLQMLFSQVNYDTGTSHTIIQVSNVFEATQFICLLNTKIDNANVSDVISQTSSSTLKCINIKVFLVRKFLLIT